MTKNEQLSYEWFQKQIKPYRLKKDKDKEYKKQERRAIQAGSFITFNYKQPVGKGKKSLRFYDENPVDVILNIRGNDLLALNFHYCPKAFRETVVKMILKLNKQRISKDKRLLITYQELKEFIKRNGLDLMIKRYKINRITNLKYIKGSEIQYIINLPSEKFIVQDSNMSESDLYNMIRSQSKSVKQSKNTRFGRKVNTSRTKRK